MSKVRTEDLTGVAGTQTTDILGNVVWYSIGKGLITPKDLREKLVASGLNENWMPNPIRVVDAFRRATNFKHKELNKMTNHTKRNTLKKVSSDENLIVYEIVSELVDQNGNVVSRKADFGNYTFNVTSNTFTNNTNRHSELGKLVEANFLQQYEALKLVTNNDAVAFEQAMTYKEETAIETTQYVNYLVREVYADKEIAIRHLVAETVDQTGKRLDYNSEVGKMILDKKEGTLKVEHEDGNETAKYYVEEMAKNFEIFKGHYDSQAIRVMATDILKSLAPVALRNNGGVYFVPVSFETEVTNFTKFCNSINELSNGWKLPVVDTFDQRKMIAHTLQANIKDLHDTCKASLGKGLKKAVIKTLIDDIDKQSNDFVQYKSLVEAEDVLKLEKQIFEIRTLMSQLLLEITN